MNMTELDHALRKLRLGGMANTLEVSLAHEVVEALILAARAGPSSWEDLLDDLFDRGARCSSAPGRPIGAASCKVSENRSYF